jgi:MarR family 2-MHQ and catechol resistance regulon transcriptional repressor
VLELLLHKGPLPVNAIGPIVDLTTGSISVAVDRLVAKSLVTRSRARKTGVFVSSPSPHAARISLFPLRKHSGQMKRVFSELSPEELRGLELALKKVGKQAAALMDES